MNETPQTPTSDERLMAAICHILGIVITLIIWVTQKDRSPFVRRQAIQAMAFDLLVMVVSLVTVGCLMVVMFTGMLLGMGGLVATVESSASPDALLTLFITLITSLPFVMPCSVFLLVGIDYIFKIIAAVQAFQGKDFQYPVLGPWVARKMG
jgi:uncharacterized Tic20 family protein